MDGDPSQPSESARAVSQKRPLEDEHIPLVSSPLNPDPSTSKGKFNTTIRDTRPSVYREPREKKESLKKREAKDATSTASTSAVRGTPSAGTTATAAPATTTKKESNIAPSKNQSQLPSGPLRYKLPPPKHIDYIPPKAPLLTPSHLQNSTQFYTSSEHVYNRKGFRYTHCIADPLFPSSLHYRQSDAAPHTPRINHEDSSSHILFDDSALQITTLKGFRMARANVGVREGRWYWECRITSGVPSAPGEPHGHVRVGFARREAPLDAPLGFDAYSYGLRDMGGQKVHMSRPVDFLPPSSTGEPHHFVEGDVIGLEIGLPPLSFHQKIVSGDYNPAVDSPSLSARSHEPAADVVRDRIPIHYKSNLYFESYEYHATKDLEELTHPSPHPTSSSSSSQPPNPNYPSVHLRTLPGSYIKVYRNGKAVGKPFENLLAFLPPASKPQNIGGGLQAREGLDDGLCGYFPAVSVFKSGAGACNFGPDWWCPPEDDDDEKKDSDGDVAMEAEESTVKPRALGERYNEQIAEDVVWDIIDEVDFWLQDGAAARDGAIAATGGVAPVEAIPSQEVTSTLGTMDGSTSIVPLTVIPSFDGADDTKTAVEDSDGDMIKENGISAVPAGVALTQTVVPGVAHGLEGAEEIKELIQEDD